MAALTTQQVDLDGLEATYASAAAGGDTLTPGERVFIHVKNGHTSPQTVTITTPRTGRGGAAIADWAVVVTNAEERFIGPFPADEFGDVTTGLAALSYSGVTALTIAVLELSQV